MSPFDRGGGPSDRNQRWKPSDNTFFACTQEQTRLFNAHRHFEAAITARVLQVSGLDKFLPPSKQIFNKLEPQFSSVKPVCGWTRMEGPAPISIGLRQVAVQSGVLVSSWGCIALLHPIMHSALLLSFIALSRLHLGWLFCCTCHMLLTGCRRDTAAGQKSSEKRKSTGAFRCLSERCWSHLRLRYWHCVFYLFLLLVAFWVASVVQEDSHEGLQSSQVGGGSHSSVHSWRENSLPSLLLNSDCSQHFKIAAKAVIRGRDMSDQLLSLLHSWASQQYVKLSVWFRTGLLMLENVTLKPCMSLLRQVGLLPSINETTAPEVCNSTARNAGWDWWWVQWLTVKHSMIHSFPIVSHSFVHGKNGDRTSWNIRELPEWHDMLSEPMLKFGENGDIVEEGSYCAVLSLMLLYFFSSIIYRACLAIPAVVMQILEAIGFSMSGYTSRNWGSLLVITFKSAAASFAVTLVISFFCIAAVTALTGFRVIGLLGRVLKKSCINSSDVSSNRTALASDHLVKADMTRGAEVLEMLAAVLTCWIILLSDRKYVMYFWATMQPLRLFVLYIVMLLRLPSAQVALLMSLPAPLNKPDTVLQRSQPLRIIDPVAVGSMLGCIIAAATLACMRQLTTTLGSSVKKSMSSHALLVKNSLRSLCYTRGKWTFRNTSNRNEGQLPLLHEPLEKSRVFSRAQKHLNEEKVELVFGGEHISKLGCESQDEAATLHPENLTILTRWPMCNELTKFYLVDLVPAGEILQCQWPVRDEIPKLLVCKQLSREIQEQQRPAQQGVWCMQRLRGPKSQFGELHYQRCDIQSKLVGQGRQQGNDSNAGMTSHLYMWKEKHTTASVKRGGLCVEIDVAVKKVNNAIDLKERFEQHLRESRVRCNSLGAQAYHIVQELKKQTENLSKKINETRYLRNRLNRTLGSDWKFGQVQDHYIHDAFHKEKHNQQNFYRETLKSTEQLTFRLVQNVRHDIHLLNKRKGQLVHHGFFAEFQLSHEASKCSGNNICEVSAPQPSKYTLAELSHYATAPQIGACLRSTASQLQTPKDGLAFLHKQHPAEFNKPYDTEVLLEEADRLERALQVIGSRIFSLRMVLYNIELPQSTLDAARKLYRAPGYLGSDSAQLRRVLFRRSKCSWIGDSESLASTLHVLKRAWPSEEFCNRLLRRSGHAKDLSLLEQKFLPLAQLPQGRQRVAIVLFLLGLETQWQKECRRLNKLEEGLGNIRQSNMLKILFKTCVEVYSEMSTRISYMNSLEMENSPSASDIKHKQVERPCSLSNQGQRTNCGLESVLDQFSIWKGNGDFNLGCLRDAASITSSLLHGFSLLQVVLHRSFLDLRGTGVPCGSYKISNSKYEPNYHPLNIPYLYAAEIHGSSMLTGAEVANSKCTQSRGLSSSHNCSCICCSDTGPPSLSILLKWQKKQKLIKDQRMHRQASKKPLNPSKMAHPTKYTKTDLHNESDDVSAREGLEEAMAVAASGEPGMLCRPFGGCATLLCWITVTLYYKALRNRHKRVAKLGRNVQEYFTELFSPLFADFISHPAKLPAPDDSLAVHKVSSASYTQRDTEQGLEMACQLLKTVHSTGLLIRDAWSVILIFVKCEPVVAFVSQTFSISMPLTSENCPHMLAKYAALAADAAVRAQESVARSTTMTAAPVVVCCQCQVKLVAYFEGRRGMELYLESSSTAATATPQ
ncbi:uncharacterized protein LOC34621270 [Cyclospora cayetanensis]|uniref:Uncharacterized protein LOC34621270 n=1 Tax=Cyclospora cayetanensis TaxID=88456 RepID=A0A6P6RV14_9EIME|nr:uncharacterized protein LOC34621270 [Cyclospora cayetanensis]